MTRLIELRAENVKRLKAVRIKPDGNLFVVAGMNMQGKSTVLDCVEYGCGGQKGICDKPIRTGAKKARIVVDLDDLLVERTFTASGSTLVVKNKKGAKLKKPQAILDAMTNALSFDPGRFMTVDNEKRMEIVRQLIRLDFSVLDEDRATKYAARTDANRECARLEALYEDMPEYPDAPKDEISSGDLAAQLEEEKEIERRRDKINTAIQENETDREDIKAAIIEREEALKTLEAEIKNLADELVENGESLSHLIEKKELIPDLPEESIQVRMDRINATNLQVRANVAAKEISVDLANANAISVKLDRAIQDIDDTKTQMRMDAEYPLPEMTMDEDGIYFNNEPFEQASQSEKLIISCMICIALNPKLRLMLIRDGSMLDREHLTLLNDIAEKHDMMILIEVVGEPDYASVIIEDGEVKQLTDPTKKS